MATMLMPTMEATTTTTPTMEVTMETITITTMRTTAATTTPITETTTLTMATIKPPMKLPPLTTRVWLAPTELEPAPVKLTDNAPSTAPLPSSRDSAVSKLASTLLPARWDVEIPRKWAPKEKNSHFERILSVLHVVLFST
ncbi:hypothetical protein GCG54_00009129 [Colletotrichum gloeosporioides]|uniref:Uncharacterized protein n=1 Tax=Colletotrichum gloeosporioides TaxID=474922 RepID=A0A8H8WNP3_COLGL|nr:uncharacterized protein GCG54_00009129 [Colletotrichum gloeosporioides]KAF3797159.1 hypothetical protein GCG54_00009129 [Colletotrichum gloeosporioides]